jgi:hypothetical protein
MSESAWRSPYTPTPGTSTPPPDMNPKEGIADIRGFVILAGLNNLIIGVAGAVAWLYVTGHF